MPRIETVDSLCDHLRSAVRVELSTIPVYLTAWWSIEENANREVQALLRSVVMEEMLHMCLAANVLHAVRGDREGPRITGEDAPTYPGPLLHSAGLELQLRSFGPEALDLFCVIEHPAALDAPPEPNGFHTIGQFYEAIVQGLDDLQHDLFRGDVHRECQVPPSQAYYGSGGQTLLVHDLGTARAALTEIVQQGEGHDDLPWEHYGTPGQRRELAHFYRFDELRKGRQYRADDEPELPTGPIIVVDQEAVRPIAPDLWARGPEDLPPGVSRLLDECDATYRLLLEELQAGLDGDPARLLAATPIMYQLGHQARALTKIPIGDGWFAGPRFRA